MIDVLMEVGKTGRAIGDSGLHHLPDQKRIELGFRLANPFWGAGFAVEVGRAWLTWFDAHLAGLAVFSDVHPEHARSLRLLSKLGFRPSHFERVLGMSMESETADLRGIAPAAQLENENGEAEGGCAGARRLLKHDPSRCIPSRPSRVATNSARRTQSAPKLMTAALDKLYHEVRDESPVWPRWQFPTTMPHASSDRPTSKVVLRRKK